MNKLYHIIAAFAMLLFIAPSFAQAQQINADTLINQGIKLHDKGLYKEAIAKYNEALKLDPENKEAQYELAYSHSASGNYKQTIVILERLIKMSSGEIGSYYDLLGSAYDDDGQPQKAIEIYKLGIKNQSDYQKLYYNLGLTFYRLKNYHEAEINAIEALKRDASHASAHKLYGEAAFYQGKKLCAFMAFCSFLSLEPQTKRSEIVLSNIDTVLADMNTRDIKLVTDKTNGGVSDMSMAEMFLHTAASAAGSLKQKGVTDSLAILEFQLQTVFNGVGQQSEKIKAPKDFFWSFYADYFYSLSKAGNIPAFVRLITFSAHKTTNLEWLRKNSDKVNNLRNWATSTSRKF